MRLHERLFDWVGNRPWFPFKTGELAQIEKVIKKAEMIDDAMTVQDRTIAIEQAGLYYRNAVEVMMQMIERMKTEIEYLQRPPPEIAEVIFREPINRNTYGGPEVMNYYEMAIHKAASAAGLEPIEDRHQMMETFKWFMLTHGLVLRFSPRFRSAKMLDRVSEPWLLEAMQSNSLFNEMATGVYLMWAEGGDKQQLGQRLAGLAAGMSVEGALPAPPDSAEPRQLPPPK